MLLYWGYCIIKCHIKEVGLYVQRGYEFTLKSSFTIEWEFNVGHSHCLVKVEIINMDPRPPSVPKSLKSFQPTFYMNKESPTCIP